MRGRLILFPTLHVRKTGKCHREAWKAHWQIPNVTRPELKVRGRLILFPTLHVRKTGKCHREAWKAHWQIPNVTRQELKVRGRPFLFPTLHVRKQEAAKTKMGKGATEAPRRPLRPADWSQDPPAQGKTAQRLSLQRIAYGNRHGAHRVDTILR